MRILEKCDMQQVGGADDASVKVSDYNAGHAVGVVAGYAVLTFECAQGNTVACAVLVNNV